VGASFQVLGCFALRARRAKSLALSPDYGRITPRMNLEGSIDPSAEKLSIAEMINLTGS